LDKDFIIPILGTVVVVLVIMIWHFFFRIKCPKCKSTSYELIESKEIDRWQGTKEITESIGRDSSGIERYKKKHIPTTFVQIESTYKCLECGNIWNKVIKQEK